MTSNGTRWYIAIDLKSFYASVECAELGLDPLDTNLVVADSSRTSKTICLAVSPSLKELGISGRARLFEAIRGVEDENKRRQGRNGGKTFEGKSYSKAELLLYPEYELDYIVAKPRMALYMEKSRQIFDIYLEFVSAEDMHVYSVDEVFIDVTSYLRTFHTTPEQMARDMVQRVYERTHITATAGIGTNLYLAKIAMDIEAKHAEPDANGARMAILDERSYRERLWNHRPITDFWRVGRGYAKRLAEVGLYTMGDVARCSIGSDSDYYNEDLLYKLFGINAELLIDHAWGWEPCTIAEIKKYRPETNSISSGQVLSRPYEFLQARVIVQEMTEAVAYDLLDKGLVTDQIVLTIGYDVDNLLDKQRKAAYHGPITTDYYGRQVPKHAHGTTNLPQSTNLASLLLEYTVDLYDSIVDTSLLVRRITVVANHVLPAEQAKDTQQYEQLDLFTDYEQVEHDRQSQAKEERLQAAMLSIKKRYGKNAVLRGTSYQDGATARDRNSQIGGHKA